MITPINIKTWQQDEAPMWYVEKKTTRILKTTYIVRCITIIQTAIEYISMDPGVHAHDSTGIPVIK